MNRRDQIRYDAERLFGNPETLLGFMRRTRKPVFHNSNVFFRDIQYAIRDYFDVVEAKPISIPDAEAIARDVIQLYTDVGLLREVAPLSYLLNAPEFVTPKGGTYTMLTIHGAPLPEAAETWLEIATVGSPADRALREDVVEYKGGEVSADGATIAALTLPITPQENAESAQASLEHAYEEVGTPEGPQPESQREAQDAIEAVKTAEKENQSEANSPKAPFPPWMKKS